MRITHVNGSPRPDSFSFALAETLLSALRKQITIERLGVHRLWPLNFRGAPSGPDMPTQPELSSLVKSDDLTPILDELGNSDLIIISAPVYLQNLNACTMAFIERCYSRFIPMDGFLERRTLAGKRVVLAYSQASSDVNAYSERFYHLGDIFLQLGVEHYYVLSSTEAVAPLRHQVLANLRDELDELVPEIIRGY